MCSARGDHRQAAAEQGWRLLLELFARELGGGPGRS
jgi:hypothetical protein